MRSLLSILVLLVSINCMSQTTDQSFLSLKYSNDLGSDIIAHSVYTKSEVQDISDAETSTVFNPTINEFIQMCSDQKEIMSCTFDAATGIITVVSRKGFLLETLISEFNTKLEK